MWLAQKTIYRDSVDLVFAIRYGDKISVAQPHNFVLKEQDARGLIEAPTLVLEGNSGQELMQALWDAGLRPNNGAGSGAEAVALRKHIDFAERIADGLLSRFARTSEGQPT